MFILAAGKGHLYIKQEHNGEKDDKNDGQKDRNDVDNNLYQ